MQDIVDARDRAAAKNNWIVRSLPSTTKETAEPRIEAGTSMKSNPLRLQMQPNGHSLSFRDREDVENLRLGLRKN